MCDLYCGHINGDEWIKGSDKELIGLVCECWSKVPLKDQNLGGVYYPEYPKDVMPKSTWVIDCCRLHAIHMQSSFGSGYSVCIRAGTENEPQIKWSLNMSHLLGLTSIFNFLISCP